MKRNADLGLLTKPSKFTIPGSEVNETVGAGGNSGYLFIYETMLIVRMMKNKRATQRLWIELNQASKTAHGLVKPDPLKSHMSARRLR